MSLNAKQQKFLDEYLVDFNATEAAKRAGYSGASSHTTGWRLLRNAEIAENVSMRIELYAMGANERLTVLSDIARAKDEKTADRLKAIEMLGKLAGDYTDKVQHSGESVITVTLTGDGSTN
jgi:phage terminase small subunit